VLGTHCKELKGFLLKKHAIHSEFSQKGKANISYALYILNEIKTCPLIIKFIFNEGGGEAAKQV